MKGRVIAVFNLEKNAYIVKLTSHASKRMCQRGVSQNDCLNIISRLRVSAVREYGSEGEDEVAIIDEETGLTLIVAFDCNEIRIITVIDKTTYVRIRDNTLVEKIA